MGKEEFNTQTFINFVESDDNHSHHWQADVDSYSSLACPVICGRRYS